MRRPNSGFTLVEILIVVILLGILAGIVVTQYRGVTRDAAVTNLKENLSKIRAQIQVYRNQHARYPDGEQFATQMTTYTDFQGESSTHRGEGFVYGPYLEQMPANPISGNGAVRWTRDTTERFAPAASDGGWWYNEATGAFVADLVNTHADDAGQPFNQY